MTPSLLHSSFVNALPQLRLLFGHQGVILWELVLTTWHIRCEKSEMCATQSRTEKPLLNASTDGYLGNEAEIGRLLFVREGKYQHMQSSQDAPT
jgi:hypothetical protein